MGAHPTAEPPPRPVAGAAAAAPRQKAAETVARRIVQRIVAGGLAPGDMLPAEADTAELYGVGRETVREALRLLEVQGLISIRRGPGGGPVVARAEALNLGRTATLYFQMAGATYGELFEAWVLGEGTLAERAAAHPDERRRLAVMAPYMDGVERAARRAGDALSVANFVAMHAGFHLAVAELARNRVLALTLTTYGQIVSYQVDLVVDPRALRTLIYSHHDDVARAIVEGDVWWARDRMMHHINAVWTYYRETIGDRSDEPIEWL